MENNGNYSEREASSIQGTRLSLHVLLCYAFFIVDSVLCQEGASFHYLFEE